ncbi:uro-adherence factor A [Lampris incognitus]|uniref:uro-adherence factor A n=1 Tax=Lampris incognitus TaxID=2546036 RepID=UPI0024B5E33D|nr:uro-adherence factor A [Lampris incognitus]
MLNPSSLGQANHVEEDSSGSDAGSEVSFGPLAIETDRFGFILMNGSTAGLGPPPELVRQREAKWISIISQWDRVLLKKTSKVKEQCQRGIPASLKAKCWPLLCGATERMKCSNNLYQKLDSESALQNWVDVIERDLDRQFPFHEMFLSRDGHGQRGLFRVLKAYTQYQPEEGYCQAQGPVAAVLLMNMPTEEAFWCLVQISEQYLPGYYSPLLEGVLFDAGMLTWVLKRSCPAAHRHLERYGVQPLMFATDWLMCLFTRHLPFNTLLRVWDLFFCYGARVLFQVAVVLVRRVLGRAEKRQQCQGQVETLEKLRAIKEEVKDEDDSFITEVCSVPLSDRDLKKQMEKQLDKWRKERPSSTFDPTGRCHGYRTASAQVLEREGARDRKERETSNLSVPLTRSASNLSLSPSLLRKRWRTGGKANVDDWEGRGKLGRNFSMGPWDTARETWVGSRPKRVQPVDEKEEKASEEHQRETNVTGRTEQGEHLKEPQPMSDNHSGDGERENPKEQVEIEQPSRPGETEASKSSDEAPSKQREHCCDKGDTAVETEPTQGRAETQSTGNIVQHVKRTSLPISCTEVQVEELDCDAQSQAREQELQSPSGENQEREGESRDLAESLNEMVTLAAESDNMVATAESQADAERAETEFKSEVETRVTVDSSQETLTQADMKPELVAELDNAQRVEVHAHTEIRNESDTETQTQTETDLSSQTDGDDKSQTIKDPDSALESNMQQEPNASLEADKGSQGDQIEVKVRNTEPAEQTKINESQVQTETETSELSEMQEEAEENFQIQEGPVTEAQKDSDLCGDASSLKETKREDEMLSPAENILQKGDPPDSVDNTSTETKTEITVCTKEETHALESTVHSDHASAECSEIEIEKEGPEQAQTDGGAELAECTHMEVNQETSNHITTDEETQTDPEAAEHETLLGEVETQTEPAMLSSSDETLQTVNPEQPGDERPRSEVSIDPVEEKQGLEIVEEKATEPEDSCIASPCQIDSSNIPQPMCKDEQRAMDRPSNTSNPQQQNGEESHLFKELVEPCNPAGHRTSSFSGDFRVRKSSSSHKSKFTRKLSEDLFTAPPQQSISASAHTEQPEQPEQSESQPDPASLTSSQTLLDATHSEASSSQPVLESTPPASEEETGGTEGTAAPQREAKQEQRLTGAPKRFGLFRRLRKEQPKIQVPKILIQDFSDGVGKERTVEEAGEEKLSSRERRKRRRERERKEKEEEKLRKKREKEQEKERAQERRKPLMKGKSFQVQGAQEDSSGSQTLDFESHSSSYADSYF